MAETESEMMDGDRRDRKMSRRGTVNESGALSMLYDTARSGQSEGVRGYVREGKKDKKPVGDLFGDQAETFPE